MLAAALRLVGVRYGLPLSVLNPDESNIVPRAWRMGHGHLDPGWYDYPSLLMAVLAPVQALFGGPSFLAARLVAVALGLGGVGATWWLGRRAYGTGAAIVGAAAVAVATTHVAYSRMAVTDVLLTLAVTCVLALAVGGRIEWAGLAVGLAASAKYPGAIAAVPVIVAGWGRWKALGRAGALAIVGFALTSPFVLIHAGAAWDDISRVQRLARAGWLGFENDPIAPLAYLDRLRDAVGPMLIVAAVGVVAALLRRTKADLILLSFALAYWLTLMPQQAHFERYILPLVPVLAVLAGSVRLGGAVRTRGARAPARLERVRRARADAHRHPPAGRRLGRRQRPRRRSDRGRSLDAAAPGRPPRREARAAGARAPVGPRARPGAAAPRGSEVGDRLGRLSPTACSQPATTIRARRGSTTSSITARSPRSWSSPASPGWQARGCGSTGSDRYGCAMSRERRTGLAIAVAVFLSGAALLGLEITASRVLAPTFGSSLFVWGSLIGIVLTGLAIGYWAGGIVADRLPSPYLLISLLTLGAVLVALVPVIDQTVLTWIVDWDPGPRLDPLLAAHDPLENVRHAVVVVRGADLVGHGEHRRVRVGDGNAVAGPGDHRRVGEVVAERDDPIRAEAPLARELREGRLLAHARCCDLDEGAAGQRRRRVVARELGRDGEDVLEVGLGEARDQLRHRQRPRERVAGLVRVGRARPPLGRAQRLVGRLAAEPQLVLPPERDRREPLAQSAHEHVRRRRRERRVGDDGVGVEVVERGAVGADRDAADAGVGGEPSGAAR